MPYANSEDRPALILSRRKLMQRAAVVGLVSLPYVHGIGLAQATTPPSTPTTPTPPASTTASDYRLSLAGLPAVTIPQDVSARKGNRAAWPVLTGVSIAQVEIPEGTWRAPHYHTNAPELAVIVQGRAKAGLQPPGQAWLELDLEVGECVYFPLGWPHWLRNTGSGMLRTYFNYGHEQPATVEIPG